MAWTGTVTASTKSGSTITADVQISDPTYGTFTKKFVASGKIAGGTVAEYKEWLFAQVREWASTIQELYTFADAIPPGTTVTFTVTPETPDADRDTLVANLLLIRRLTRAVDAGIVIGVTGQTALTNAKTSASNILQARTDLVSYLDLLSRV